MSHKVTTDEITLSFLVGLHFVAFKGLLFPFSIPVQKTLQIAMSTKIIQYATFAVITFVLWTSFSILDGNFQLAFKENSQKIGYFDNNQFQEKRETQKTTTEKVPAENNSTVSFFEDQG